MPERAERRALERVDGDVDLRRAAVADVLAVVEHRRLVLLALADDDDAVHRDRVEHEAHRVDGGLVGGDLVAAADPAGGGERGGLGDAHELEREVAVGRDGWSADVIGRGGVRERVGGRRARTLSAVAAGVRCRSSGRTSACTPTRRRSTAPTLLGDLQLGERAHDERPWVVTNFATTADGRATIDGRPGPIGDDGDLEVFRRLRTQVDVLLVGTRTLGIEHYGRAVRRPELRAAREALGLAPEPLIATVSRSGELPLDDPLFAEPEANVSCSPRRRRPSRTAPHASRSCGWTRAELTLMTALRHLRAEHGAHSLLCEGGPTLMGALLHERLVDELVPDACAAARGRRQRPDA